MLYNSFEKKHLLQEVSCMTEYVKLYMQIKNVSMWQERYNDNMSIVTIEPKETFVKIFLYKVCQNIFAITKH